MKYIKLIVFGLLRALGFYLSIDKDKNIYDIVKERIEKYADTNEKTLFDVIEGLTPLLGMQNSGNLSFFKDIMAELVTSNGELTPVAQAVKDAMADGKITKKELVLIILAYETSHGGLDLDDISDHSQDIADLIGYKRPVSVIQQVKRTAEKLPI